MEVWIVLIEDRHSDVEPLPFSTEELAVAKARSWVPDDAEESELTDGMRRDGWVLYLPYGPEGDCVRVVKRAMDGTDDTDDPASATLAGIKERFETVTEIPLEALPLEPEQAAAFAALVMDIPSLVAAVEDGIAALERHQQWFESKGVRLCGGCLEPVPCKDTDVIGRALAGKDSSDEDD